MSPRIAIGRRRPAKAERDELPTRHNLRGIRQLLHHSDPSGFDPLRSFATDRFREANPGMIEVAGLFRQVHLAQKCLEARIGAEAFQFRFQF